MSDHARVNKKSPEMKIELDQRKQVELYIRITDFFQRMVKRQLETQM